MDINIKAGSIANTGFNVNNFPRGETILFNNTLTGVNGPSTAVNFTAISYRQFSLYGIVDGATVISVQFSNDNVTWYTSSYTVTMAGAGTFGITVQSSAYYVRVFSSNSVTATVYLDWS